MFCYPKLHITGWSGMTPHGFGLAIKASHTACHHRHPTAPSLLTPPLPPPPPTLSDITSSSFKLSWACPQGRGAPVTDYMVNLQHLHSASLANGHAATSGDSVLESLDDASSTSGSTAHAQVRPMHQLKTQPTANAHNDWLNPPAFAIAYACICSLGSS